MNAQETPEILESKPETLVCKNCQTRFEGNFCPHCGQSLRLFEKPVKVFLYDFLGDLFAFDSRLWRSLFAMLFRPGQMVAEYVGGKHIRYTPPFRAYVFFSFFFFIALNALTKETLLRNKENLAKATREIQKVDSLSRSSNTTPKESVPLDSAGILQIKVNADSSSGQEDKAVVDKALDILRHPEGYVSRIYKSLSWAFFLLMPLLGGFLWLFFRTSRTYYVPHLIFAINIHTVAFLLLTLVFLVELAWPDRTSKWEWSLLSIIPLYTFAGALQLYKKGWFATFWRLGFASFWYLVTIVFSVSILFLALFKDTLPQ